MLSTYMTMQKKNLVKLLLFSYFVHHLSCTCRGRRGRDLMVVGVTTTSAINA